MTWYPEAFTSWPMTTMNMRPDPASGYPGRTYRFYTGETIYKFGDGLSYSTFTHSYSSITASTATSLGVMAPSAAQLSCYEDATTCTNETDKQNYCRQLEFKVALTISNTHWRNGAEVVLLYFTPPNAGKKGRPLKQLIGFQRLSVAGNENQTVEFLLKPCTHFVTTRSDGTRELLQGIHTVRSNGGAQFSVEF
jgi:beta-D-xylosidase 4